MMADDTLLDSLESHAAALSDNQDNGDDDDEDDNSDLVSRSIRIDDIDEKYMEIVILWCRQADKPIQCYSRNATMRQLTVTFVNKRDAEEFIEAEIFSLGFCSYKITKLSSTAPKIDMQSVRAESSESSLTTTPATTAQECLRQKQILLSCESGQTEENEELIPQEDNDKEYGEQCDEDEQCRVIANKEHHTVDRAIVERVEARQANRRAINDIVAYDSLTFLKKQPIGFGGFGAVYSTLHKDWGCQVAYKRLSVQYIGEINKADEQLLIQKLKYEAEIHRQLRHPNIVSMLGVVFEENNYGIILEFVTYGSWCNFSNRVKEESESFIPSILKMKLAFEISSGMSYLHSLKIIHCDLKVQNVLIGEEINAKISDFGLSKWKNYSRSYTNAGNISGTPSHISPEQWKDDSFRPNDKSDVYSFSILLWEMFTERHAYEERQALICDWVMSGRRLPLDCLPQDVSSDIDAIIKSCWSQHPDKRPSFGDLTLRLRSFLDLPENKHLINEAKTAVLTAYYKRSDPVAHDDHVPKINRVRQTLCELIRRLDQILQILFEKRAVSSGEHEVILSQAAIFQKAAHLLDVIIAKPPPVYQRFLEALDLTNQHHLHRLLEEKEFVIAVDHKTKLMDNFTYLKQNILLSGSTILDNLLELGVLDGQEVDEIRSKNTEHERINQLLHLIMRTSQEEYQLFLESLNKSEHRHVNIQLTVEHRPGDEFNTEECAAKRLHTTVLNVLETEGAILNMTLLGSLLFLLEIRNTMKADVCAYNTNRMKFAYKISIQYLEYPSQIIACPHNNCLYISSKINKTIYRYDLQLKKMIRSWTVGKPCQGLFVTKRHSVLATLGGKLNVNEYTPDGGLIRCIRIDDFKKGIRHCVQLSNEQFVFSYYDYETGNRGVCVTDNTDRIVRSYPKCPKDGVFNITAPYRMALDEHDNVMIMNIDGDSGREISILSPNLDHIGYFQLPDNDKLGCPVALHFDQINHRIYVGDRCGRVFVLGVYINEKKREMNKQDSCTVS